MAELGDRTEFLSRFDVGPVRWCNAALCHTCGIPPGDTWKLSDTLPRLSPRTEKGPEQRSPQPNLPRNALQRRFLWIGLWCCWPSDAATSSRRSAVRNESSCALLISAKATGRAFRDPTLPGGRPSHRDASSSSPTPTARAIRRTVDHAGSGRTPFSICDMVPAASFVKRSTSRIDSPASWRTARRTSPIFFATP